MNNKTILLLIAVLFSLMAWCQDYDDLNNQAYKERDNKNYQKAIELSTQSINKKANARAYIIRADCRYLLGDYLASIDDYNSSLTWYSDYYGSDNKERAGIYYYLGRNKQNLARYNDAISDFNMALSYNYEYPAYAYWNRGACYYDQYKFKEAEEDYIKAIDRMSDTEDLSILYKQRGDCQAQLGNYETAHSLFARAITYNAKNYKAYWQRGYYKVSEYKYEDGLADYTKALEIINTGGTNATTNEIALLHRNKAILYQNLMQYDNAIVAINKSIETDPNYSRSYRTRAEIYKDLKKYDKARADYENAITLQTDKKMRSDIYLDRSMMAWNILDFKSCLDDLNKAIEADPGDGMNYWHRSMLYGYKKNYPLAIKDCNSAMELYKKDSSSTASLIWLRAEHQDHSGDFKGAVEDFQVYLKYYPDSYSGYYELGRLFKWKMKNNDLADANLSKALVLAEKYVDTVKVAYIKMVRGNKEEALKMMQEVVALTSENNKYDYKWNLHSMSCMYALAGNTVKAFEFLDKSLKAGFDDYRHLITDRDLISLMPLPQWKTILAKYKVPVVKN